ncbi:hypothetical protein [Streptacidiphilus carbonis]|uniref:hypothetical protein n=1 Tax=Streptacidiphilus carbonis TaxID=105422 RepID=UPI0005A7CC9F|nr:hypothetical protein [Streptacidiphilus carbonis]
MTPATTRWQPTGGPSQARATTPTLPDGRRLVAPQPQLANSLELGMWISLEGRPYRITDMRSRMEGGRVLHLAGHAPHSMTSLATIPVYTVAEPVQPDRHSAEPPRSRGR